MEIIKINNLSFKYPVSLKENIHNINLNINRGDFICVCGKSGCGKTTLLRLLKPILAPHGEKSGNILYKGEEINSLSSEEQASKIGFVMQNPDTQIVTDKVWHELAFGLESLGYDNGYIKRRVSEMSSYFGIQNWFHKKTSDLSGGQKQLLNLASVMTMNPEILILDEPTGQLDPLSAAEFLNAVYKINKELGVTVIISEHRLEELFDKADRIVVMDAGRIVTESNPSEIALRLKEKNENLIQLMPSFVKIFASAEDEDNCPVNTLEARNWLAEKEIKSNVENKEEKEDKNTVISIKDLWAKYEKDGDNILKNLELRVYENELLSIVGGNGTGKTTLLSVISGILKKTSGTIKIKDGYKITSLCQNPEAMFLKNTVRKELYETLTLSDSKEGIEEIINLCELGTFLDSHPYDLSGGEKQRLALAKVLITGGDILLLDEPTKGMDSEFKDKFAYIIKELKGQGKTIIMVSHDIEFCAEHSDRVGMFFDGQITGIDTPRSFFKENIFYTTIASKMAKDIIPGAVLSEDIVKAIGGKEIKKQEYKTLPKKNRPEQKNTENKDKKKVKNIIGGFIFIIMFFITSFFLKNDYKEFTKNIIKFIMIIELTAGFALLFNKKHEVTEAYKKRKIKFNIRTVIMIIILFVLVPFTVYIGVKYLDNRKYYFISLLIILETLIPFTMMFEGRKPKAREIAVIAVLCAIAISGRSAFYMMQQFKPVVAIIIISGICLGGETGFFVGAVTGFLSNMFFGQGPWAPWQMTALGVIGFLSGVLTDLKVIRKTRASMCIFGGIATLIIYGGIMNPASVIIWNSTPTWEMILSAYIVGLPYDIVHAVATIFFLWFISVPMIEKIERVKLKYGINEV